ncbi:FeoA family protein [Celeribacter persicus]|uniref:Fe2+ transport system protein FeoA n=1 Tax=Celeribacter persicus TaxID=1651082 RepID=A0A2T5HK19_9RHOB|nr:FeoA family protein [Celeribacter persicus]PTQ71896.1 Fe2+ transport system protein FeoA [Celeribacter persicus]
MKRGFRRRFGLQKGFGENGENRDTAQEEGCGKGFGHRHGEGRHRMWRRRFRSVMGDRSDTDLSLNDIRPGQDCIILRLHGFGPTRQRLLDLGFQPGRRIRVLRNAPLRDPIEVQVGDTFIALRRHEADHVQVERAESELSTPSSAPSDEDKDHD